MVRAPGSLGGHMSEGHQLQAIAARRALRLKAMRALLGTLLLALHGCASLPTLEEGRAQAVADRSAQVHDASVPGDGTVAPHRVRAGRAQVRALLQRTGVSVLQQHLDDTAGVLGGPIAGGNAVRLLIDGPVTHAAMFEAIAQAKARIDIVTYILDDDEVGQQLATLLIERRRAGVSVRLMYDSVGSMATANAYFERLSSEGVSICEFNPVNPTRVRRNWKINNRDHRKIMVVDGSRGFAGGINVSSVYSAGSFGARRAREPGQVPWRDTHLEIRGPAVSQLVHSVDTLWQRQHCPVVERPPIKPPAAAGTVAVSVVTGGPESGRSTHYLALLSAFTHASARIYITCAYFVPDPQLARALIDAAQRGVEVRLLLPSISDSWLPLAAGRSHYASLLAGGVRIFERAEALLHAKTAVVDGVWSTVGSSNLDFRSFVHNEEANVIVFDAPFAAQLEQLFDRDLERSREITASEWSNRGIAPRVQQWLARQFEYLL